MAILGRAIMLPLAAVSALLLAPPPQAEAQNLFQILFGGWGRQTAQPERQRAEPARPNQKVKRNRPPRIASPSYHDYKAEPLVEADFLALQTALEATPKLSGLEPKLAGAVFQETISRIQGSHLRVEKDIAEALVDYYSSNPDFIWVSGLDANERAMQAVRTLDEAEAYGLVAAEYSVPVPRRNLSLDNIGARLDALLDFEMELSARVLRYVRDAEGGRVDPNRMSGYYDFPAKPLDLVAVLKSLSHTSQVRTYLESRHPQNAEYQALRVELEMLRADDAEEDVEIDSKLLLKPGETSTELPKLLAAVSRDLGDGNEFEDVLSRNTASQVYGDELVPVIRAAQEKLGLKPDGVIGPRTVTALAGMPKAMRLNKVLVALEQMRWLPSDLGNPRVFINQPAFTASYIEGARTRLATRTVIGMPTNQTSFFYDEIEQVDYNPYWGVPQSIIVNEMLPRLRRDPGYLDRSGYEVTDAKGRRIPSSAIDWGAYGAKIPYNIRQVPSEANALGELKILFPNKHAIYMHDTPAKELFQQDVRAFSHGCIRLQDPRGMAAAVLGTSVEHIAERLEHGHSSEMVTRKVPVYVAYFTAWPDDAGKVQYFHDIYDRDSYLQAAIEKTSAARLTGG
ncbi:L,D-transpeptidase family protein [Mesorhizobium sp. 1B3]|uniref:L,D-transpeptidase family protein n=1 Tax=Mesorhizobium sp. 1B3 TaxID=3243599 RepID=UPI003D95B36B